MGDPAFISPEQLHTLAQLGRLEGLVDFYLVGGTATAFHLGHRVSLDIDLFSRRDGVDLERVRRAVVGALDNVEVIASSEVTLQLKVATSPVDIVSYPYPPIEQTTDGPAGFPVASLTDLATMKLAAIAKRGIKRDFWDLYEICNCSAVTLGGALEAYSARFGQRESDIYYVVRSLTFFEDAEKETTSPRGLTPDLWTEIKAFFIKSAPEQLR